MYLRQTLALHSLNITFDRTKCCRLTIACNGRVGHFAPVEMSLASTDCCNRDIANGMCVNGIMRSPLLLAITDVPFYTAKVQQMALCRVKTRRSTTAGNRVKCKEPEVQA